ncbi:hypothetical protein KY285_033572 [Solanum tuberosum]|nr:hypothetical protein KY285_033572 [Solanum tuberosum]
MKEKRDKFWVEDPARFHRSEVVDLDCQEVRPRLEKERDKAANSIKQMLTSQGLGQMRERKDLVDNDMHLRNVVGSSSHVDKAVDAIKQMLTSQRIGLWSERNDLVDMMGHAYGGPTAAGQVKPQSNYLGQPTHLNKSPTKVVEPFIKDINIWPVNTEAQNTLSTCIEQSMWSEVSRRAIQTKSLQLDDIEKNRSKSIMS